MALKTDYKAFIAPETGRRFHQTPNSDGTVTMTDVTVYTQEGDYYGPEALNTTNAKVNEIDSALANKANKEWTVAQLINHNDIDGVYTCAYNVDMGLAVLFGSGGLASGSILANTRYFTLPEDVPRPTANINLFHLGYINNDSGTQIHAALKFSTDGGISTLSISGITTPKYINLNTVLPIMAW